MWLLASMNAPLNLHEIWTYSNVKNLKFPWAGMPTDLPRFGTLIPSPAAQNYLPIIIHVYTTDNAQQDFLTSKIL